MLTAKCPRSLYDETLLMVKPRIFGRKQFYPLYQGKGLDDQDILIFPSWHPDTPREQPPQVSLPSPLYLPITGIEEPLNDLAKAKIQCTINFVYHGDSTVTGLIRPVEQWIKSTHEYPYAPLYGKVLPMYGRGKSLHTLARGPKFDTSEADVFILKYQVDMINMMGFYLNDEAMMESRLTTGIRQYGRQIDWLIQQSRLHSLGAMVILVGPNPINSPSYPKNKTCLDGSDLVARVDTQLRERLSRHAEVYYISVLDVMAAYWPLTELRVAIGGVHMTPILNFYVAREIRRVVISAMAQRATLGLGRIPRFTIWDAIHGRLNNTQVQYADDFLGLVRVPPEERKEGTGQEN